MKFDDKIVDDIVDAEDDAIRFKTKVNGTTYYFFVTKSENLMLSTLLDGFDKAEVVDVVQVKKGDENVDD